MRILFNFTLTVQARLMFPLEILSPHHKRVLNPDQALTDTQHRISARTSEVIPLAVCVPNVKWSTGFHNHRRIGEGIRQEPSKCRILHIVVLNLPGDALIIHIVRRVGEQQIHLRPPHELLYVCQRRAVSAHKAMVSKLVHIAKFTLRLCR